MKVGKKESVLLYTEYLLIIYLLPIFFSPPKKEVVGTSLVQLLGWDTPR